MSRINTLQVHKTCDCVCVGTAFIGTGTEYYCYLNFHHMTSKNVTFYDVFIESKLIFFPFECLLAVTNLQIWVTYRMLLRTLTL